MNVNTAAKHLGHRTEDRAALCLECQRLPPAVAPDAYTPVVAIYLSVFTSVYYL